MTDNSLRSRIEAAFERRADLDAAALAEIRPDVETAINLLESGGARVAPSRPPSAERP